MLFFHAVTVQAIISAVVAGYIRNVDLVSGAKYAVALVTTALVVWIFVEGATGGSSSSEGLVLLLAGTWPLRDVQRAVRTRVAPLTGGDGED